jgi:hypothetical protein
MLRLVTKAIGTLHSPFEQKGFLSLWMMVNWLPKKRDLFYNALGASTIVSSSLTFTLSLFPLAVPQLSNFMASKLDPSVFGYNCATRATLPSVIFAWLGSSLPPYQTGLLLSTLVRTQFSGFMPSTLLGMLAWLLYIIMLS